MQLLNSILSFGYQIAENTVRKNKTICLISYPDCADNSWSFFKYLVEKNTNYQIIWLVKDVKKATEKIDLFISTFPNRHVKITRKNSLLGLWQFLRARNIFFTHGHYPFVKPLGREKLINLWHGMPIKAIGILDSKSEQLVQASDCVIATSEYFAELMAKAFNVQPEKVIVSGQPRCDELFYPAVTPKWMNQVLDGKFNKIILWMPTYLLSVQGDIRNDGNLSESEYRFNFLTRLCIINSLAAKYSVGVIVKLHPMDFLNKIDWPKFNHIDVYPAGHTLFDKVDLYSLLGAASGLITDISSVAIDYLLTKKPLCIVWPTAAQYNRSLLLASSRFETCSDVVYGYEELETFFKKFLENKYLENKLNEEVKSESVKFFHENVDGFSSGRLAQYLDLI